MKNQYFGDFGDYQKFSLLKILRDTGKFKILVHWMKTKDDGSSDGKKITYLKDLATWDSYDKEIFRFLSEHIGTTTRDLGLFERSPHAKGIDFVSDYIEDPQIRLTLLDTIRKDTSHDLVFFDPDNGIEVKSTISKNIHKYVLWTDIEAAYNAGKSILIYQHYSRKNREVFIKEKVAEIERRIPAEVFIIKAKHSVYLLIAQKEHQSAIRKSLDRFSKIWDF